MLTCLIALLYFNRDPFSVEVWQLLIYEEDSLLFIESRILVTAFYTRGPNGAVIRQFSLDPALPNRFNMAALFLGGLWTRAAIFKEQF